MHRNPDNSAQYIGADDVAYEYLVRLDGIEQNPRDGGPSLVGILIDKIGPDRSDPSSGHLFGYWPASPSDDEEGGWEIDDVRTSLPELCEEYGLPLADVIDRVSIALLRFAQKCKG